MDILTDPCVSIKGNAQKGMLTLRWKGYCPSDGYRHALETARKAVLTNNFKHWLADLRNMEAILRDDERWTVEEWFPKMGHTNLERMAIITSSDFLNAMSVDRIMDESRSSYGFDVAYFDDERKATAWLNKPVSLVKRVGQ
jgi:hypothetical protein